VLLDEKMKEKELNGENWTNSFKKFNTQRRLL
jgi:hypothetical protein